MKFKVSSQATAQIKEYGRENTQGPHMQHDANVSQFHPVDLLCSIPARSTLCIRTMHGLGSPFKRLGSPFKGLGSPLKGLGSPFEGLSSPLKGLGSPFTGMR